MCSAVLFSECQDIDIKKIEEDLEKDKQSERNYILQLRSDERWIVGYIQENTDKLLAEQSAIASLSQLLETRVKEQLERTIEEVETDERSSYRERVRSSLTFISNVTIKQPKLVHFKKGNIWRVISIKCREEYAQEQDLYNDRIFEKVTYYWEQYSFNSTKNRLDIATSIANLVQARLLMMVIISTKKTHFEMSENISRELDYLLNNIYIKGPDVSIKVEPYSFANNNIELNCDYQSEDGEVFPVNGLDLKAKYIQGSVENFDDWSNNAKSVYVTNGNLIFHPGYINSKSQNLKVIFYPDIEEIVNRLIIRLESEEEPLNISSEAISKLINYTEENRILHTLTLKNTMQIQTYVTIEESPPTDAVSNQRLPGVQKRYIRENTVFNIVNDEQLANMKVLIQLNIQSRKANLILLKKDQHEGYEEIAKTKDILYNTKGIVLGFKMLESSMFDTDLFYEKCADVTISIENDKYKDPIYIQKNAGKIKVRKGKVIYKVIYNKDKSAAFFDTTFYVNTTKDLNDFHEERKICFEKKSISYPITFNKYLIADQNSILIWDNKKQKINKGNTGTILEGFRHKEHTLVYKKNGLKPLMKIAHPTKESEYPIYIDPERIELNFINNMIYTFIPGRSQIELFSASDLKQIQGYLYQTGFLFLLGKTIYHYYQYDSHLSSYYGCRNNYVNASQNLDTLYDQCLDNHDLIAPEIDNIKLFGQSLALLFLANLIEVTVDNFLF